MPADHHASIIVPVAVTPMTAFANTDRHTAIPCPEFDLGERWDSRQHSRRSRDAEHQFPHRILLRIAPNNNARVGAYVPGNVDENSLSMNEG
jgi:hypothetical protein